MRARLIVAPWWLRWLVGALWCAVWIVPLGTVLVPDFIANIGWTYGMASLMGFSLLASALMTFVQQPIYRSFAAAVAGTTTAQRSEVFKALRRGDVPADPKVLAAAIRVGTLKAAYRHRLPRWLRSSPRWSPVIWIGVGVLEFLVNDTWRSWFWLGLTTIMAVQSAWAWHRVKRSEDNLQRLRAAADSTPLPADDNAVSLPPQRLWASLAVATVMGAGVGAMAFISAVPRPGCSTGDAVVNFVYANRDLLEADVTTGTHGLDRYQGWSDRLQDYSRQKSAPEVAPRLSRIAQLSANTVSLVRIARTDHQSADRSPNVQSDYQRTVSQLVEEDNALARTCHPRR